MLSPMAASEADLFIVEEFSDMDLQQTLEKQFAADSVRSCWTIMLQVVSSLLRLPKVANFAHIDIFQTGMQALLNERKPHGFCS